MIKKILSLTLLFFIIIPCCMFFTACNKNPQDNSNLSTTSSQTKELSLNNYHQYITITPNITTASSGYNLTYKFLGSSYCSFENVVIKYQLFDYNILLNNPKVLYDNSVESYKLSLTKDGTGSTIKVGVTNYQWRIEILSISGNVKINTDTNKTDNSISLNLNNYEQYIDFSQVNIQKKNDGGLLYWKIDGVRNYVFIDVVITYDYYDYDFYGNEVIYDEHNYGYIGTKPYTCKLNLDGDGSTLILAETEEFIKVLSISGTIKAI